MENEQLVLRIRAGEDVAENMLALYQNMLGLIVKLARSFGPRGEAEDLEQEGYIALCNAVRAYRPGEGTPFASCAAHWIRQGMGRYLENCGRPVRIPSGQAGLMRKYRRLCSEFQKEFGRDPSDREVTCAWRGLGRMRSWGTWEAWTSRWVTRGRPPWGSSRRPQGTWKRMRSKK